MEQDQADWLKRLSGAEDFASAGEAALVGLRTILGVERAAIRLMGERWEGVQFQFPPQAPIASGNQTIRRPAQQSSVGEVTEDRCEWSIHSPEATIELSFRAAPENDV